MLGIKYEGQPVPLQADPTFWAAPKEEIDKHAQGCGPGPIGDYFVPDSVWGGLSIKRACRIHDWEYHIGIDKDFADETFKDNMERIIITNTKWNWLKTLRMAQANLYYKVVSYAGDHAYAVDKNNKNINYI
ncbi:MAG: hypothetical protein ACERKJ_11120 [Candidatus Dadabacteria bacterium]